MADENSVLRSPPTCKGIPHVVPRPGSHAPAHPHEHVIVRAVVTLCLAHFSCKISDVGVPTVVGCPTPRASAQPQGEFAGRNIDEDQPPPMSVAAEDRAGDVEMSDLWPREVDGDCDPRTGSEPNRGRFAGNRQGGARTDMGSVAHGRAQDRAPGESEVYASSSNSDSEALLSPQDGEERCSEAWVINVDFLKRTTTSWKVRHVFVLARSLCVAVPGLLHWSYTLWHVAELYPAASPAIALLCIHLLAVRMEMDGLWREARKEERFEEQSDVDADESPPRCTCTGVATYTLLCAEAFLLLVVGIVYHAIGALLLTDSLRDEPQREWIEYHAASIAISAFFYCAAALGVAYIALKAALSCYVCCQSRNGDHDNGVAHSPQVDLHQPRSTRKVKRAGCLQLTVCFPLRSAPRPFSWPLHGLCCLCFVSLLAAVIVALVIWMGPGPCASGISEDCYALCDPLDVHACALPYPSSFFIVPDNATATGWRVAFGPRTLPYTRWGRNVDHRVFNEADGFAVSSPIFFHMDADIELNSDAQGEHTARYYAIERSLNVDTTPTVVIDLDSLHVVPHFIEVVRATTQHTLLSIVPAVPLNYSSHYAVGVRNLHGRHNEDLLGLVRPNSGFVDALRTAAEYEIRDSDVSAATHGDNDEDLLEDIWDRDLERAKVLGRKVLPAFHQIGFASNNLQLAWDFRTQSTKGSIEVLQRQRKAAIIESRRPRGSRAPVLEIDRELPGIRCQEGHKSRKFVGTLRVPDFLEPLTNDRLNGLVLRRDSQGGVSTSPAGERLHDILIILPCNVTKAGAKPPVGFMQYGHGIFGNRGEAAASYVQDVAEASRHIVLSSDFEGMNTFNLLTVLRVALSRVHQFPSVTEPLAQAFVAKSVLLEAVLSHLDHPAFTRADGAPIFGGVRREDLVNTYYGVSLGGILGAAYASLASSEVARAALGNPGAPFALILPRSAQWTPLRSLLRLQISSDGDEAVVIALAQHLWSTVEGSGWLGWERAPPLLVQTSRGDTIVSALSAELLARAAGALNLEPVVRNVFGVPSADLEHFDSASNGTSAMPSILVQWNSDNVPRRKPQGGVSGLAYVPGPRGDEVTSVNTHQCVRYQREAIAQIASFLSVGNVTQPCPAGAPCTMSCG